MNQIEYKRLTIDDYEDMLKLWEHAGLPYKAKGRDSKTMTAKQMKEFPEFFLGAFHGDQLIGVVVGSYETRFKGWINRLAVAPEYQRQGIAQGLVKRMEDTLRKHGAKILCALIETPNDESVSFFRKMGYITHENILYVSKRESEDV
ncbi:MAG: GNAT family N-acetyltransferase [Candidatus Bathyarchaeia archaeon]|jgi:GNAT superfamily N-acetyltransferase|nr:GNAT family N-acetyltransferase [Candidatus Bathyarchaeota archaeon A05DMB-4]MDH7594534.1 GNAT family N-acetyltransferase [Candidatus Bathyarchaeota archaeon]